MNTTRNVSSVVLNNQCIGCGACTIVCDFNAITMDYSQLQGYSLPTVNQETCTSCKTCLQVCFGFTTDYLISDDYLEFMKCVFNTPLDTFSGFISDGEVRRASSSGGIISAIAQDLLQKGLNSKVIVTKSEQGYPPFSQFVIAHSIDDIESARGTKYCPVRIDIALKQMRENETYGIVALPCQLYTIQKLIELKRIKGKISLFIGLICGGTPTYNALEYIMQNWEIDTKRISHVQYRANEWPGTMRIESSEGIRTTYIKTSEYWPIMSPWFHMERCLTCMSGMNPRADLVCGDYWNPIIMENDEDGTSLILCRTEKAKSIIDSLTERKLLVITRIDYSDVTNSQKGIAREKPDVLSLRLRTLEMLGKKHVYSRKKIGIGSNIGLIHIINELLIHLGRFLTSKRYFWKIFFWYYKSLQKLLKRESTSG
jgi:coenzyme F420 hydrogenase subunit beta